MSETNGNRVYAAIIVVNGEIINWEFDVDRSAAMELFEQDQHFYTAPSNEPVLAEGFFCEFRVSWEWNNYKVGEYINSLQPKDLRPFTMFSWDNRSLHAADAQT